ncbi:FecR family protein [Aquimarina sp. AU474]|uniref:FecR family protein n=1 Tax=Aquimarina sp. AU474 TaxID=2108529 RepID=UPI001359B462|nr:FecR domain-containing protein [Aquimarina sp. AU474]
MNIEQEDHILPIITRYLKDDVQEDERKFVKNWIAQSEINKNYFEEVEQLWKASEEIDDFDKINVNDEWDKFTSNTSSQKDIQTKENNRAFLKIAASIAVIIGLGAYFMNYFNADVTLIAQTGEENRFVLPDQSVVWLNEGSELTYKKDFEGKTRASQLKGEGFFEVAKNPEKPFVVSTNNTETKVLGTSFNLKTDTNTKETKLVLVTGKVQFTSDGNQEILLPGDKVTAKANGILLKKVNDNPNFISWKSKVLKFEDVVMSDVVKDIEQFYNVELVIENLQLKDCTLTSVFEDESLDDVLETLTILFDITHQKIGTNRILIKGGNCNS